MYQVRLPPLPSPVWELIRVGVAARNARVFDLWFGGGFEHNRKLPSLDIGFHLPTRNRHSRSLLLYVLPPPPLIISLTNGKQIHSNFIPVEPPCIISSNQRRRAGMRRVDSTMIIIQLMKFLSGGLFWRRLLFYWLLYVLIPRLLSPSRWPFEGGVV